MTGDHAPVGSSGVRDGRIIIEGLRAFGFHGVRPEEKRDGQYFIVDLDCRVDLTRAARTDDISATVDYSTIAACVTEIVTHERFDLLEALAERIAGEVLSDERIAQVVVRVSKLRPPLDAEVRSIAVEITRRR